LLTKQVDEIDILSRMNQEIKEEYEVVSKNTIVLENELEQMKILCDEMRIERQ
jgi:hypothetical protein